MGSVTQKHDATDVDGTIDVELISDITDTALKMELSTSTREAIDSRTQDLIAQLNGLVTEELGDDEDPGARDLIRQAYRLLELTSRPTKETAAFNTFFYMRDVATVARRLLWIYTEPSRHAT